MKTYIDSMGFDRRQQRERSYGFLDTNKGLALTCIVVMVASFVFFTGMEAIWEAIAPLL